MIWSDEDLKPPPSPGRATRLLFLAVACATAAAFLFMLAAGVSR